jgi:hypothetical protein
MADVILKQAHGFAQTDTVKHCPFCGSGDVWGGSDGTITCEFDGATFQVSVEPQFPSAPGSMNGVPLNIDGDPDAMGQADADEAMAIPEGVSPSSGEDLGPGEEETDEDEEEGGPPWANGEDEDEDDEDEGPAQDEGAGGGVPWKSGSYRTFAGDRLSEGLYLRHLAIRHAEEPQLVLAEMRRTAAEESTAWRSRTVPNRDTKKSWGKATGLRITYTGVASRRDEAGKLSMEYCGHKHNTEEAAQRCGEALVGQLNERHLASMRRAAQAEEPEENEEKRAPGTTSGSKRCEVCGWVKPGVGRVRGSGPAMCGDCYKASGQKTW